MKRLQNDFTTPEQSKRLLELGVPADSANCMSERSSTSDGGFINTGRVVSIGEGEKYSDYDFEGNYPIWSVGRLIDIIFICWYGQQEIKFTRQYHNIDAIVESIERYIGYLDFSKLEE